MILRKWTNIKVELIKSHFNIFLSLCSESKIVAHLCKWALKYWLLIGMFINHFRIFSGIHFDVDMERVLQNFISLGLKVFFHAVDSMLERHATGESSPNTTSEDGDQQRLFDYDLDCEGVNSNHSWRNGPQFYR